VVSLWIPYSQYRDGSSRSVVGTVVALQGLRSPELEIDRDILVYLPPSYADSHQRYPVIYMHDAQNLFDPHTSFVGVEWQVDEALESLSHEGQEAIVVGISNRGQASRMDELSPYAHKGHSGSGDLYLQFLVETLKPLIDLSFRTRPDREHTGIMGSSLGGLISLYAFFNLPDTFGLAGIMSPSLWAPIFAAIQSAPFQQGRLYLDVGTWEGSFDPIDRLLGRSLSRRYRNRVRKLLQVLEAKGYRSGQDLLYVEEFNGIHQESAWARRLPQALRFLLTSANA
jgi:predicted alpha/beta superfamily hydrolase